MKMSMTSHNDPGTWCHERRVRFLLKRQNKRAYQTKFITLRVDGYVWTDRNSLTGIDRQLVFFHKLHLKWIQKV